MLLIGGQFYASDSRVLHRPDIFIAGNTGEIGVILLQLRNGRITVHCIPLLHFDQTIMVFPRRNVGCC